MPYQIIFLLFSFYVSEVFLEQNHIFMEVYFVKKMKHLKVLNYFCKRAPPQTLGWILNAALGNTVRSHGELNF